MSKIYEKFMNASLKQVMMVLVCEVFSEKNKITEE